MQIIGDIRDRDISVGITQDIAGGLGDIEIIIVFQCAVSGFGSFAEFCEDGIEPALDMAFIRRRLFGILHHPGDDFADIFGAGIRLDRGILADMAASEHMGRLVSVEADPCIGPGVCRLGSVEDQCIGSDEKVLVLVDYIMSLVVIKMSLPAKHEVKDIIMADNRSVRLLPGTFFISAGDQMKFFGSCLMEHHLFFFHKIITSCKIYIR